MKGIQAPWGALRHRNYRLLWSGNGLSQLGDHMQQVAQNWLVWQITGSISALGLAAFAGMLPRLLLGILGGPVVDNNDRRRLLGITQSVALLIATSFAVAVISHAINLALAILFITALDATQTLNQMCRQAFLQEIVPRDDIASAISLNGAGNNLARIVGPAIGGMLIPLTGVEGLMLINALTFLAVLVSLWLMKVTEQRDKPVNRNFRQDLTEGYSYIWGNRNLSLLLYLSMASALLIVPVTSLLPGYVEKVLHQGPRFFGFLFAAYGVGGIFGAMSGPAVRRSSVGHRTTLVAALGQGLLFVAFALSSVPWLSLLAMFGLGYSTVVYNNSMVTALQLTTPREYLGRVMGVYLLHKAVTACGALLLGIASSLLGVPWAFALSGLAYLLTGFGVQLANPGMRAAFTTEGAARSAVED